MSGRCGAPNVERNIHDQKKLPTSVTVIPHHKLLLTLLSWVCSQCVPYNIFIEHKYCRFKKHQGQRKTVAVRCQQK